MEGRVTAVRARKTATPRNLAVRAPVWPDDTVTTAADASVAIRLARNGALWELQGAQTRRVDAGLAWRAQRNAPAVALADRPEAAATAAAGRHSEQEAGQAVEAAARPLVVPAPPAAAPVYRKHATYDFPNDMVEGDMARPPHGDTAPAVGLGGLGTLGHGTGGGSGPAAKSGHGGDVTVSGGLSSAAINKFLMPIRPAIRRCYAHVLATDPQAAGKVVVHVVFGATGRITQASIASSTLPPQVGTCIANLLKRQPKTTIKSVSVELPFIFKSLD